jgi:FkbM family methyltransferase
MDCERVRVMLLARWRAQFQGGVVGDTFATLRRRPRLIIDVFLYNDEADMLEVRLATLDHVVDFHVAIEANHTLSGVPKKLWFAAHQAQFAAHCHRRLRVFESTSVERPLAESNSRAWWANEVTARLAQAAALDTVFTVGELGDADDTLVINHDVDEIPSPEVLWLLKWCTVLPPLPLLIKSRFYYYSFGWRIMRAAANAPADYHESDRTRAPMEWDAPLITTLTQARVLLSNPPTSLATSAVSVVHDAGWHCSSCLPLRQMANKFRSFAHVELAQRPDLLTDEWLLHVKRTGIDYALRVVDGYTVAVDALREAPPFVTRHAHLFNYMLFAPDHSAHDRLPREHGVVPHTRRCDLLTRPRRTIFVDAGANRGDTIEKLVQTPEVFRAANVARWDIIESFEGNVALCSSLALVGQAAVASGRAAQHQSHCPAVVNVGGGQVTFYLDTHYESGVGSSISPHHNDATFDRSKARAVKVDAIDLVDHLEVSVHESDFVVLKIDVEGAEWAIFQKMITHNATRLIDVMICEWHWYGAGGLGASPEIAGHYATAYEAILKASNPTMDLVRWD